MADKEVIVERDTEKNSSSGPVVAIVAIVVLLVLAFIGFQYFGGSGASTTNVNVTPSVPTQ